MSKPDYTKLDYFDNMICPHCGAILKCKTKIVYEPVFGEDPDYFDYQTVRCSNCKISGSSHQHDFESPDAWKIPKDTPKTVTEAQAKYIVYLARHFNKHVPYIINKEVAATWIAQHVDLLIEETRFDLYIQAIENLLLSRGYSVEYTENYCGVFPKYIEFQKKYWRDDGRISFFAYLYINFLVDERDFVFSINTSSMSVDNTDVELIANDLRKLPKVLAEIKKIILDEQFYPTKEEARIYLNEHKAFTPRFSISFITHETPAGKKSHRYAYP